MPVFLQERSSIKETDEDSVLTQDSDEEHLCMDCR